MDTLSINKPQAEHNWQLFSIVILTGIILHYIVQEWILVPEVYYRSLADKLSDERLAQLIAMKEKMLWLDVLMEALKTAAKVLMVALVLMGGAYFFEYELPFKSALGIALVAALIPIAAYATKIVWFSLGDTDFTLKDFNQTEILSLKHLLFPQAPTWLAGILNWVGLFEIAYWAILIREVSKRLAIDKMEALGIVAGSYGVANLLLLSLMAFFSIWLM